jgi:F-type H+-transporting ATPase subunit gamma
MATLKVIRKRISSVRNTQQITKAMKMVAAARLRRAQEAATATRPYAQKLEELLRNVAARVGADAHPMLQTPEVEKRVHLLVVTADRGLCGGYNTNLIKAAEAFLRERAGQEVELTIIGRRGYDHFKRRQVNIVDQHINLFGGPNRALAEALGDKLSREFSEGRVDGVYVLFSRFRSALSQVPTVIKLLPVSAEAVDTGAPPLDYLYEPEAKVLLERLLKQYINTLLQSAFLEAIASEFAAKMTAMDSATSNASKMISRLTLEMNRARQAAITKELMEIVSGAEALKG